MTARGDEVVVRDDDRRGLQVASAALAQIPHEIVAHLGKVQSHQREVVLADMSQQVVDFLRFQHAVVTLLAVDGRAAGIGEVAY